LADHASSDFFSLNDELLNAMCLVVEGRVPRMVKSAVPVLCHFKTALGENQMRDRVTKLLHTEQQQNEPALNEE